MPDLITGAHCILYSLDADADRTFLRDVFGLSHVDLGEGWLIFALPPAELAVHPSSSNDHHELYFTCANIDDFMAAMFQQGIACDPVEQLDWGRLTRIALPGGSRLGVYQPLHARPKAARRRAARKTP